MYHTFIFIGRSGSGKGTQVDMLKRYVAEMDPTTAVLDLETGGFLREYFSSGTYSSEISRKITAQGLLQPAFITIYMWGNYLLKNMRPDCHVFIDGTPRTYVEATAFDTALQFYDRQKVTVIILDAPHDVVTKRLLKRGRADDTHESIKKRLGWFDSDVAQCIEYYREHPRYDIIEINGDQTIEKVHTDIIKALKLE